MFMEKNIYVILVVLALSCHLVEGHYTFPLPNIILASDRSINIDNIRRRRASSTPRPVKQIEQKKNINRRGSIEIDESDAYSSVGPWGVSISTEDPIRNMVVNILEVSSAVDSESIESLKYGKMH